MEIVSTSSNATELLTRLANIPQSFIYWKDMRSIRPDQVDRFMNRLDQNLSELGLLQDHMDQMPPQSDARYLLIVQRLQNCRDNLSSLKSSCKDYRQCASGTIRRNLPRTVGAVWNTLTEEFEQSKSDIESFLALIDSVTHPDVNSAPSSPEAGCDAFKVVTGLVPHNPEHLVFDFDSKDENGEPSTSEGKFKKAIFDESCHGPVGGVARGLGGVGKTCALRKIGRDAERTMRSRFKGGVVFITFGQQASEADIIEEIANVVRIAGGPSKAQEIRDEQNLYRAIQIAGQWFKHYPCLFLFDDLWCLNGIRDSIVHDLSNIGQHAGSRIAFTTRDENLRGGTSVTFAARESRSSTAQDMLLNRTGLRYPVSEDAEQAFLSVLDKCAGLPLAISLVGAVIRKYAETIFDSNLDEVWQYYLDHDASGVICDEPRSHMQSIVLSSLDIVEKLERGRNIRRKFSSLSVIRSQKPIPIKVIERLWGESYVEAERGIQMFRRFSVVILSSTSENGSPTTSVGMHDLFLEVARDLASLQHSTWNPFAQALIESYVPKLRPDTSNTMPRGDICEAVSVAVETYFGWSETFRDCWLDVPDDNYINDNVCWLLTLAGKDADALWLLLQPNWIVQQLQRSDYLQISNDINLVIEPMTIIDNHGDMTRDLELVDKTVQRAANAVRRSKWGGMAWFQLYGRLIGHAERYAEIDKFLKKIVAHAPKPWCRPSLGCLPQAGDGLLDTVHVNGYVLFHSIVEEKVVFGYNSFDHSCYISLYDMVRGELEREDTFWDPQSPVEYADRAAYHRGKELVVVGVLDGRVLVWDCQQKVSSQLLTDQSRKRSWLHVQCNPLFCCLGHSTGEGEHLRATVSERQNSVASITISWDATRIVAGFENGTIRVWSATNGGWHCSELCGHQLSVNSVAVSEDGRRVVSGSADNTVRVWDGDERGWQSSELRRHQDEVHGVAISRDGQRVVSGSYDGTVRVWCADEVGWRCSELRGHRDRVFSVAINEDGRRVVSVSGSSDRTVRVWDENEVGWQCFELRGPQYVVQSVAISVDGRRVLSWSDEGTICVWDADEGGLQSSELHEHRNSDDSIAVSENARQVAYQSDDRAVRVWDVDENDWHCSVQREHQDSVHDVAVSENGRRVVSGSADNTVRVWDANEGRWQVSELRGHQGKVVSVAISKVGRRVVSGSHDHTVRVWDEDERGWQRTVLRGHQDRVCCVAISEDGRRVVSGCADSTVLVWDAFEGGWQNSELRGHQNEVRSVAIHEDGQQVVSGSFDNTVRVWDAVEGGWQSSELRGHQDWVGSVAISENGRRIVSGSCDDTMRVWELKDQDWVNIQWKGLGSSVIHVSIKRSGAILEVHLADRESLWFNWELKEEVEKEVRESAADGTRLANLPTETELLQTVEGEEIWRTATGFCIKKGAAPFLVFVELER